MVGGEGGKEDLQHKRPACRTDKDTELVKRRATVQRQSVVFWNGVALNVFFFPFLLLLVKRRCGLIRLK